MWQIKHIDAPISMMNVSSLPSYPNSDEMTPSESVLNSFCVIADFRLAFVLPKITNKNLFARCKNGNDQSKRDKFVPVTLVTDQIRYFGCMDDTQRRSGKLSESECHCSTVIFFHLEHRL